MDFKSYDDEQLQNLYKEAKQAYYGDSQVMTDSDFDELEREMENRDLEIFVGTEEYGELIKHLTPMLSLEKVQINSEELTIGQHQAILKLLRRSKYYSTTNTFALPYKADGLAINGIYENGNLRYAVTRGSGKEGRNVIEKVRHLLPEHCEKHVKEIRYECVLPTDVFAKKYAEEYSNSRNLASGILGNIDTNDDRIHDLRLIPLYAVDENGNFILYGNMYRMLITKTQLESYEEMKIVYASLNNNRPSHEMPTDGFVIHPLATGIHTSDHNSHDPNYSLSVKFPPKGAETTVKTIFYKLGRSGEFIPNIILVPVTIDGRSITRVNGYNQGFIEKMNIGIGSRVLINIAGDIIPRLDAVLSSSEEKVPLPENSVIEGVHLMAVNAEEALKLQRFIHGCYVLGFKHFGWSSYTKISQLLDFNCFQIFNKNLVNVESLRKVGFGPTQSQKFIDTIELRRKSGVSLHKIILAMAIDDCGWNTSLQIQKFIAKYKYNLDPEVYQLDYDVKGLTRKVWIECTAGNTSNEILSISQQLIGMDVNLELAYLKPTEQQFMEHELVKYILTGSPKPNFKTKDEFKKTLPNNWIEVGKMDQAQYLITDSPESNTSKMQDAKRLNVQIITYLSTEIFNA